MSIARTLLVGAPGGGSGEPGGLEIGDVDLGVRSGEERVIMGPVDDDDERTSILAVPGVRCR